MPDDLTKNTHASTTSSALRARLPIAFATGLYLLILLRTAWLTDDTLITLRVVRNLLNGFGPVWNIGERVQAYTHPLWMFVLSAAIAFTHEYYVTVIVVSIAVSLAATLIVTLRHATTASAALVAFLLLVFSKAYGDYSTSGLENPLTHLLLVVFYLYYFTENETPRTLFWGALIAALGVLNRMDIALLYLPPLLYGVWRVKSWRAIGAVAAGFLPLVAWELFSIVYYGFPFPNTAYAKLNTGIPISESVQQGFLYLLRCFSTDPMTGFVIVAAIGLGLLERTWKMRWLAIGVALYLLYVVRIGGDYTTGRFLSAPLLCAVVVIARQPAAIWVRSTTLAAVLFTLLVGVMPFREAALFVDGYMPIESIDNKGIADERKQYLSLRLLASNRFNRFYESGAAQGWIDPATFKAGAIGRIGFATSDFTHIVDVIGLADPLIARLPARYDPNWRTGHPVRTIPDGYVLSERTGENHLVDPDLARYYDKLTLVIRGDLFTWQRFEEIWRLNRDEYAQWIDQDRYRFPDRLPVELAQVQRTVTATDTLAFPTPLLPLSFGQDGVLIDFGKLQHTSMLEIGVNLDRFALRYMNGKNQVGEQVVRQTPLRLGEQFYQVVWPPREAVAQGYTAIHLYPQIPKDYKHESYPQELSHSDYTLTFFDPIAVVQEAIQAHPEQLAELYYFDYFQGDAATRGDELLRLFAQMQAMDTTRWRQVPLLKMIDLSQIPDREASRFFRTKLTALTTLSDHAKTPLLSYLGAIATPTVPEADVQGLQFKLYFDVLGQVKERYSLWFHIVSVDTGAEWMIYDYFPDEPTDTWQVGAVVEFPALLQVDPGSYEISFGFWTPERERLYADVERDIYWINLGARTMPSDEKTKE